MDEHPDFGFREAAGPDDRDMHALARRALQDAYDWRDDDQRRVGAPAVSPEKIPDPRSARDEARRLRRSTSRTVGV
ncbi:MAG TPA: hypothetical protein VGZ32_13840 [Actinocrinis sp.]|jgi:hypothetical protein|uniref:hypothetical protein n=1 Tax=Actinocrinis sp. TaxID=1920516 RepID=UPI002DDD2641|nr:hypothetical protein [Actinocrinis sp.]HEV3171428.1 hypothetical protein [Actinocrinis sp.]